MRVVIINPWLRTVTESALRHGSLDAIYKALTHEGNPETDDFNVVSIAPKVYLYVDGEGFLKPDQPVWYILGYASKDSSTLPLCGMGIIYGGVDAEGNDLALPEYISTRFCASAVTWTEKVSTGMLEPTVVKPGVVIIGAPLIKDTRV